MNLIKPNVGSRSNQENERDYSDDHGYVSSIYQRGDNSLMNQINPINSSQISAPADDTTDDDHIYLYNSGKNSSVNHIKPNISSTGYHRLMDTVEFGRDVAAVATPGQSAAVMALSASRLPASPVRIEPRPTFASVALPKLEFRFPPLQLPARQPAIKDGRPAVFFTDSDIQPGLQRLQHSLIADFFFGRPAIDVIRRCFMENWAISDGSTIGALDALNILIILTSEDESNRILAHPLRKAGRSEFHLFRWTPDFHQRKEHIITPTRTWVQLPGLPSHLFDQGYISSIVSTFATFIAIDEKTRMYSEPSFARACIELDFTKPIPSEVWVSFGHFYGFWQPITYENKLLYCSKCKLHGHDMSAC